MAELTDLTPTDDTATAAGCCSASAQETCCEPSEKAACCADGAAGGSCGCSAGSDELRETVRARYAAAAIATTSDSGSGCLPGVVESGL